MNLFCVLKLGMVGAFVLITLSGYNSKASSVLKPRVLISSDIGGTDSDDFQSMIHLLMYANQFEIEGLVSSPFGDGRKSDFLDIIADYEKDFAQLEKHSTDFPKPAELRAVVKQGAIPAALFKGYSSSTEGSGWIIKCAKEESDRPLWVLVWGGIEDLAKALHDAPEIKENIRVYWIGGPNKKWSINAYTYIAEHHGDLWMIEANATYRGWFMDENSPEQFKGEVYYDNFIQGRGVMGKDFIHYYDGKIKMGDTPSLAYVMNGVSEDPTGESWGGSFEKIHRSTRKVFEGGSTNADTVAAYATLEYRFNGPKITVPDDSVVFKIKIQGQVWSGYYLGEGVYGVKYASKKAEHGKYETSSEIPELDGLNGEYVSTNSWPGKLSPDDYPLGTNWYSDRLGKDLFIKDQQGAKTISIHREAFLSDWGERWKWMEK